MFKKVSRWLSSAWIAWLNKERPAEGLPLCDFERIRYELRPCDVLLIEGRSRVSEIIQNITQSSWSHAAMYIGRLHDIEDPKIRNLVSSHYNGPPDTQLLIESIMGKGAIISDLTEYESDHIRLCRPRGLSRQDAQKVIAHAVQKLGFDYDVRHVMDLARFLLPWTLFPRGFRSKLFAEHAGDNTKTVCSTMIAEAFDSVEFPILPLVKKHDVKGIELITRNTKLYSPRDFDYSPYFEIIKYPFVEFADYAIYRKLPWNREGLVSHDRLGVNQTLKITKEKEKELIAKEKENTSKENTSKEKETKVPSSTAPSSGTFPSSGGLPSAMGKSSQPEKSSTKSPNHDQDNDHDNSPSTRSSMPPSPSISHASNKHMLSNTQTPLTPKIDV